MKTENKVKLIKALAFPASAAFMFGIGVTAIQADEVENPNDGVVQTSNADNGIIPDLTTTNGESTGTSDSATDSKSLDGDISIDGDTAHDSTPEVKPDTSYSVTGNLDVNKINEQLSAAEAGYGNLVDYVNVKETQFYFDATYTIPDGMYLADDYTKEFIQDGDAFEITSFVPEGNTVKVRYGLKDLQNITKYTQISQAVKDACSKTGIMGITIHGLKVNSGVADGSLLTMSGTVKGYFHSIAYVDFFGYKQEKEFNYNWEASQSAEGKDYGQSEDDSTIQLTVKVKNPKEDPEEPETPDQPDTPKNPEEPSTPETPKTPDTTDDVKKEETKEETKTEESTSESTSEVTQLAASTTTAQTTESSGVQTSTATNVGMLSMTTVITAMGAMLLRKRRDDE